jgi:hypothetical protein
MNPITPAPHYPHVAAQVLLNPTAGARLHQARTSGTGMQK